MEGPVMQILNTNEIRTNFDQLLDRAATSHEPILISGTHNNAVLISAEDWSAIQETLHLLAIPGMQESIKAGMAEKLSESAKELDW